MRILQKGLATALMMLGASAYAFELPPGECDPQFEVCDGNGGAIVAASPEVTTPADTNLTLDLNDLLDTGPGIELVSATIEVTSQPSKGTATVSQDGNSIIFSPNGQFNDLEYGQTFAVIFNYDVYSIQYTDGGNPATQESTVYGPVTVTVTSTGTPPPPPAQFAATTLNLTTDKNTDLVIGDDEALFTVEDGHTMTGTTFSVVGETPYGQLTIDNEAGTITFSSNGDLDHLQANDQPEVISFKYRVADTSYEGNDIVEGTINITVNGVDDAPAQPTESLTTAVKKHDVVFRDGELNAGEMITLAVSTTTLATTDKLEVTSIPEHLTLLGVYGGSGEQQDITALIKSQEFSAAQDDTGLTLAIKGEAELANPIAQLLFQVNEPASSEASALQIRRLDSSDNTMASASVTVPELSALPALASEISAVMKDDFRFSEAPAASILVSLLRNGSENSSDLSGDWLFTLADQSDAATFDCANAVIYEDGSDFGGATSQLMCADSVADIQVTGATMAAKSELSVQLDLPSVENGAAWNLAVASDAESDFSSNINQSMADVQRVEIIKASNQSRGGYSLVSMDVMNPTQETLSASIMTVQIDIETVDEYISNFECGSLRGSEYADAYTLECSDKKLVAIVLLNKDIDADTTLDKVFHVKVDTGSSVDTEGSGTRRFNMTSKVFSGAGVAKIIRSKVDHDIDSDALGLPAALMALFMLSFYRLRQRKH